MVVRIVKNYKKYRKGDVVDLSSDVARSLVDSGVARVDRMFTPADRGFEVSK